MKESDYMKLGKIIFLNGASSSGKTSISKELLAQLGSAYWYLSIDDFMDGINQGYLNMYPKLLDDTIENLKMLENIIGPQIVTLFHYTISFFVETGKNIVIDHVLSEKSYLVECLTLFKGHEIYFIGVHCPLDELEIREIARGDRPVGLTRSQYYKVHNHGEYDLEVYTDKMNPHDCAKKIAEIIASNCVPKAINNIRESYSS
jgi:chloramphenicol 3-O phosphotransferase